MTEDVILEVRQLSKVYGRGPLEITALKDVSFTLAAGELVAVMGPAEHAHIRDRSICGTGRTTIRAKTGPNPQRVHRIRPPGLRGDSVRDSISECPDPLGILKT
jgi:hypothetical protein